MSETKQRAAEQADEKATAAAERVRKYVADVPAADLTAAERIVLAPPERSSVSQWAEKHRTIRLSARPGPWRNATQPVVAPVMDLIERPGIEKVWIQSAAQVAKSEIVRNHIAFTAHTDPGPALLVLPNAKDGKKIVKKYVRPLLNGTEVKVLGPLKSPRRSDNTMDNIALLNAFDLQLGYSGSASSLASEPRRRIYLDELNKFAPWDGAESTPVDLAEVRTTTYGSERKIVGVSTPTTPDGEITKLVESAAIKLYYFWRCPRCGCCQTLSWDKVKYPSAAEVGARTPEEHAAAIEQGRRAGLQCERCLVTVGDEEHKVGVRTGYWATSDQTWKLHLDGREEGKKPPGSSVGVYLHGLCSAFASLWKLAAEFVQKAATPSLLMGFKNSRLGEVFHIELAKVDGGVLRRKCRPDPETVFQPPKAGLVPKWATRLILTVDTQVDYFFFVIRAWGPRLRSRLIHHGRAMNFEDLEHWLYRAYWPNEDPRLPARRPYIAAIDAGGGLDREESNATRTEQVYRWCAEDPTARLAFRGSARRGDQTIWFKKGQYQSPRTGEMIDRLVYWMDPLHWRDMLASYITQQQQAIDYETGEVLTDAPKIDDWQLHGGVDDEYLRHISVMTRTIDPRRKRYAERWLPSIQGARHDFHDCESMQFAVAHGPGKCLGLPDERTIEQQLRDAADAANAMKRPEKPQEGTRTPDGREFIASQR